MSAQIKDGGPAFPGGVNSVYTNLTEGEPTQVGMTLRDYFAGKAFPAVFAAYVEANGRCIGTDHVAYNCASHAYRMADAMLRAREVQA